MLWELDSEHCCALVWSTHRNARIDENITAEVNFVKLSPWIFFVAWCLGSVALVGGLEVARGVVENVAAICIFGAACALWWLAYRISKYNTKAGFIVIALWTIAPLGALLNLQYYLKNAFFYGSSATLLLLIAAAVIREAREGPVRRSM